MIRRFIRHLREWQEVVAWERQHGENPSKLAMLRNVARGLVSHRRWRRRVKICLRCPIYDPQRRACRNRTRTANLGCGCYVPFLAKLNTPYTSADGKRKGCWGRAVVGGTFGWE